MSTSDSNSDNTPKESSRSGRRDYGGYANYGGYGGSYGAYGGGYRGGYGYDAGRSGSAANSNPFITYLLMIRERIWWVILSVLVFLLLALANTYSITPEYKAAGKLRLFRNSYTAGATNIVDPNTINGADDFYTQIEQMRSSTIIDNVAKRLTAAEKKAVLEPYQQGDIFSGPLTEQEVFAKQRSITPQRQSLIVNVEFTHPTRELARKVAELFCECIQKDSEDQKVIQAHPQAEKLRSQSESQEDELRRLQERKNQLVEQKRLYSISKDTATLSIERAVLVKDRDEAQKQIDENQIVIKQIDIYRKQGRPLEEIQQIRADPDVSAAHTSINASKVRLHQMIESYTELHPKLIAEREALKQLEFQFKSAVEKAEKDHRASSDVCIARHEAITRNLLTKEEEVSRVNSAGVELKEIEDEIKGKDELLTRTKVDYYAYQAQASSAGVTNSIRIIEKPSVPEKPFNKSIAFSGGLGAGVGLVFGIILAIAIGTFDDRIKSARDIEAMLGLPLIGTVPHVTRVEGPARAFLTRQDKDRISAEAIRSIYSSLKVNPSVTNTKVFLITSTRPSEGKSFIVTNLALIFSQHSERVLVIDADLRLPNIGPSIGLTGDAGLSRWFNDEITLDEAIVHDVAPGLDVLPVGISCKNPTQVISHPKFLSMIDELRKRYDRIFIDSPPIGPVSDALHLLPKVDGVIYAVRYNSVRLRAVITCLSRLRDAQAPLIGIVLNAMSLRMASAYTDSYDASYKNYYVEEPTESSEEEVTRV